MGGLFGGGGQNIATSETRLGAIRFQTSAFGYPIPILYGQNRISGNLIWYSREGGEIGWINTTKKSPKPAQLLNVSRIQQNPDFRTDAAEKWGKLCICSGENTLSTVEIIPLQTQFITSSNAI